MLDEQLQEFLAVSVHPPVVLESHIRQCTPYIYKGMSPRITVFNSYAG